LRDSGFSSIPPAAKINNTLSFFSFSLLRLLAHFTVNQAGHVSKANFLALSATMNTGNIKRASSSGVT
jgi:hypothetical protein